ncbi:MAG: dihydropteroate synthase [Candidatus Omnitrophica bacterium]|nr:dihydropteroate synthase [Candidatus Omnitrophota bacterium]
MIMGIMNLTPDSFSRDGRLAVSRDPLTHVRFAQKLVRDGADILDIGAESTRPGARKISFREELRRILPTLRLLVKKIEIPISVDTYKPEVAIAALDQGACIINNIMGVGPDVRILKAVRDYGAAIVLMHMRGTPATMQKDPVYRDVVGDILTELRHAVEKCLEIGIKKNRIIIDPGFGFGKRVEHNLEILRRLESFAVLRCPVLVGMSRKSFIGRVLGQQRPDQRTIGSVATACTAVLKGVHIVRVHDVAATRQAVVMADAIL